MLLAQLCMRFIHVIVCVMFVHFYCCRVTSCANILEFIHFTISGHSRSFQTLAVSKPATGLVSGALAHRNWSFLVPFSLRSSYCRVLLFVKFSKLSDEYSHWRKGCWKVCRIAAYTDVILRLSVETCYQWLGDQWLREHHMVSGFLFYLHFHYPIHMFVCVFISDSHEFFGSGEILEYK